MDLLNDIIPLIVEIGQILFFVLFFLGAIENYFLTRYGGTLNRGFTIWRRSLKGEEYQFLSNLRENIIEEHKVGRWRTKKSFILSQNGEILIRYANPRQRTSWPLVGYFNISNVDCKVEYRLSILMLASTIALAFFNIFVFLFLLVAFMFSFFMEYVGLTDFLSKRTDIFMNNRSSRDQERFL